MVLTREPPSTIVETVHGRHAKLNEERSTKTLRDDILKRLSMMLDKADQRSIRDQHRYKDNFYRKLHPRKFKVGDYVFVNRPPPAAKSVAQKADSMAQTKLLTRTQGPFEVIQVYDNILVVKDANTHVPVSIGRCTLAPEGGINQSTVTIT